MNGRRIAAGTLLLSAVAIAACGTARKGEPLAGVIALAPPQRHGAELFARHCHKCHPGGEGGLGPSLNDKPLPSFLIRTQVRAGMGVMPSYSEEEIDDREMKDLLAYLDALHDHGG